MLIKCTRAAKPVKWTIGQAKEKVGEVGENVGKNPKGVFPDFIPHGRADNPRSPDLLEW